MSNHDDASTLKLAIQQAGEAAQALARELAAKIAESDVPPAHWDEVMAQVSTMLAPEDQVEREIATV
jgi:hypothetical protein